MTHFRFLPAHTLASGPKWKSVDVSLTKIHKLKMEEKRLNIRRCHCERDFNAKALPIGFPSSVRREVERSQSSLSCWIWRRRLRLGNNLEPSKTFLRWFVEVAHGEVSFARKQNPILGNVFGSFSQFRNLNANIIWLKEPKKDTRSSPFRMPIYSPGLENTIKI